MAASIEGAKNGTRALAFLSRDLLSSSPKPLILSLALLQIPSRKAAAVLKSPSFRGEACRNGLDFARFGLWWFGCWVQGLGFRVQGLGFRVCPIFGHCGSHFNFQVLQEVSGMKDPGFTEYHLETFWGVPRIRTIVIIGGSTLGAPI